MPAGATFDLERFVTAQAPVFATALAELQSGQKRGHWMWFIFPQLRGLGHSAMARHYGVGSLAEARAYLAPPPPRARPRPPPARAGAGPVHAGRPGDRGPVTARHLRFAGRREVPLVNDPVRA